MSINTDTLRFYTVAEIAQLLRIKPKTVRNRMATGSFPIPYKKFGKHVLFPRQDVERFLDELPYANGQD